MQRRSNCRNLLLSFTDKRENCYFSKCPKALTEVQDMFKKENKTNKLKKKKQLSKRDVLKPLANRELWIIPLNCLRTVYDEHTS